VTQDDDGYKVLKHQRVQCPKCKSIPGYCYDCEVCDQCGNTDAPKPTESPKDRTSKP